ncbi:Alfin [Trema orientale]|uniref:PHD finger protein ALFIN-LIKE n=1 Tax=Trema orientale TaxID=63057 RepID=A0A2P5BGY6_TREOI|nr:Alfin [Trema orientale]
MEGGGRVFSDALDIFIDFRARKAGIIKALTTERDNLCLFGLPTKEWEVGPPYDHEALVELPQPVSGINISRDRMLKRDWLRLVARHSDSWLLALAFFQGRNFNQSERQRLFILINALPTVHELVKRATEKQPMERQTVSNDSTDKSKSSSKELLEQQGSESGKHSEGKPKGEDEELDYYEYGETLCAACREKFALDEFWICCDTCDTRFHGKCVNITPAKAEHIKQYMCPVCKRKGARH